MSPSEKTSQKEVSIAFRHIFWSDTVDYQLSLEEKYLRLKIYHKDGESIIKDRECLYEIINDQQEEHALAVYKSWKRINGDINRKQKYQYIIYNLQDITGIQLEFYKVVRLRKLIASIEYPEKVSYYKKVGVK